jgi:chromosome segregation protein
MPGPHVRSRYAGRTNPSGQSTFLRSERDRLDQELRELGEAVADARKAQEALDQEEGALKRETAEEAHQVARLQAERQGLHQALAESRIRTTSLEERREALGRSTARLEVDLGRERAREAELLREADDERSRAAALARDIDALRHSLDVLSAQEAQEAETVQSLQRDRDRIREALMTHEEGLKALRKELADLQQTQAATGARHAALQTERSLLQKHLQQAPQGEALRALADREESPGDPEALAHEAEELRGKLATLGAINMAALEEYEALSERYRFMTDQATDLTASATSLKAMIAEINQTIQEVFGKTLTAVNEHLLRYWQRLFGGGEAELILSEGDETEEPGVEIRVRIPGKRTTILSLLSGGEKTLGAISFLMALWATRPSPFIVLDEIDASLDDVNVDRFTILLRELTLSSQVIVVTHHPRTIEVADLLYGITMEEPGVSRLISVRLGKPAETPVPATTS